MIFIYVQYIYTISVGLYTHLLHNLNPGMFIKSTVKSLV